MKFKPRPTQDEMIEFAMERKRCALWGTMGSGKSASAAHVALAKMYDSFEVNRWLIVAPPMVTAITWPSEFAKWDDLAKLPVDYLGANDFDLEPGAIVERDGVEEEVLWSDVRKGEVVLRKTALALPDKFGRKRGLKQRKAPFTVVSYTFLPWLRKTWGVNWPYQGVILDEAVFIKTHDSVRHAAIKTAVKKGLVSHLIELTGRPQPNGEQDLFGQVLLLDDGERLGATLTEFRSRWCQPVSTGRNGQVYKWGVRPPLLPQLHEKMAEVAISVSHDIGVPLVEVDHLVKLPASARRVYNDLEQNLMHRFDPTSVVLSANQAVLTAKLMQVAQGAVYDSERLTQVVHDEKLNRLAELLEAINGPVLLAYPYQHDFKRLAGRFRGLVRATPEAVEAFKRGEVKLMATHPASLAHGTDGLQGVSNTVVWFGVTHNADHYLQLNARLLRPGQQAGTVFVHRILAEDTIEMEVARVVLPGKIGAEDALLAAVKARGNHG